MPLRHLVILAFVVAIATLSVVVSYATGTVVPAFLVGMVGGLITTFTTFMGIKMATRKLGLYVGFATLAAMTSAIPLLRPLLHLP